MLGHLSESRPERNASVWRAICKFRICAALKSFLWLSCIYEDLCLQSCNLAEYQIDLQQVEVFLQLSGGRLGWEPYIYCDCQGHNKDKSDMRDRLDARSRGSPPPLHRFPLEAKEPDATAITSPPMLQPRRPWKSSTPSISSLPLSKLLPYLHLNSEMASKTNIFGSFDDMMWSSLLLT